MLDRLGSRHQLLSQLFDLPPQFVHDRDFARRRLAVAACEVGVGLYSHVVTERDGRAVRRDMPFPDREVSGMQLHDDGLLGVQSLDHFANEVFNGELIREDSVKHQLRGDGVSEFDRGLLQFGKHDLLPMHLHGLGGNLQLMSRLIERFDLFASLGFKLHLSGRRCRSLRRGCVRFCQREVNQPTMMRLQPFRSRRGRVTKHNATNRQFQTDCRFGHRSSIPASVREILFARSAIVMCDRLASRFFGADCRESSMKVAFPSTNAVLDTTGLPSLLSVDAGASIPTDDLPPASSVDSATDPTIATFDAVLAIFGVMPNLPQPTPEVPLITLKAGETSANPIDALEPADAATQMLLLPLLSEPTALRTNVSASTTVPATARQFPAPPVSDVAINASPTAEPLVEAASFEPPIENGVPLKSAPMTFVGKDDPIALTNAPTPEPDLPMSEPHLPEPSLGNGRWDAGEPQRASETSDRDSSQAEVTRSISDEPAIFGLPSDNERTEKPLVPQPVAEISRADIEPKARWHRHAKDFERATAEVVIPSAHMTAIVDHETTRVNAATLTESVSAAVQAHSADLSPNKPLELHLRLDPPELGTVRVHLRLTDDMVSIRFIAGDEAITRILETQLPDLRQSLAERGLEFAHCDVSCDSRQQQSSNFRGDSHPQSFGFEASPRITHGSATASKIATIVGLTRNDRLNVLA